MLQVDLIALPLWIVILVIVMFAILLSVALVTGREVRLWEIVIGPKHGSTPKVKAGPKDDSIDTEPIIGIDKFLNEVIKNEIIRKQTLDLIDELKNLKTIKNPVFQDAISIDYGEFLSEVKNWTRSSVKIQGGENDNFLINLYKNANHSVFSTCLMDYFNAWETDFGHKLLEAHDNNQKCKTIRVFVFHDKSDITEDILQLINHQKDFAVTPYILIDKASECDDFTIIDDGEVIGFTNEMKFGKRLTTWYFDEDNQIKRFLRYKEAILNKATSVS